jgi:sugar lactone lactonase YvrE
MLHRLTHCAIIGLGLQSAAIAQTASYRVQILVPPSAMHAVEGIVLDDTGRLFGTSIHGQRVYQIDLRTGAVTVFIDSPHGESDDVAVGPAGTPAAGIVAWTAQRSGEIRAQRPGGQPVVLMRDVPRVNPIAFNAAGRLFTAQVGAGDDTLWELDPLAARPPRRVASAQGRLNGFAFGPDGRLYAPQFGTDRLVAIDIESGARTTIATGLGAPAAVKVAPNGDVYSVDYLSGDLWRTVPATGQSAKLTNLPAPLDSLVLAPGGRIILSSAADSSLFVFEPASGALRTLVRGWFTLPLGVALVEHAGRPSLLVTDPFGYRFVDPQSGAVTRPPWAGNRGASTAVAANAQRMVLANAPVARLRAIDRSTDQIVWDNSAVRNPRGLVLLGDGSAMVADVASGELLQVDGAGARVLASGLQQPVAVMTESPNVLLVTEFSAGRIQRVDVQSGAHQVVAEGLDRPTGLARLPDGRLAVVEASAGRVLAIDLGTKQRTVLASGLPLSLDGLDLPQDSPAGIVVDAAGAVYLACPGDNSIRVLRPRRASKNRGRT